MKYKKIIISTKYIIAIILNDFGNIYNKILN